MTEQNKNRFIQLTGLRQNIRIKLACSERNPIVGVFFVVAEICSDGFVCPIHTRHYSDLPDSMKNLFNEDLL